MGKALETVEPGTKQARNSIMAQIDVILYGNLLKASSRPCHASDRTLLAHFFRLLRSRIAKVQTTVVHTGMLRRDALKGTHRCLKKFVK